MYFMTGPCGRVARVTNVKLLLPKWHSYICRQHQSCWTSIAPLNVHKSQLVISHDTPRIHGIQRHHFSENVKTAKKLVPEYDKDGVSRDCEIIYSRKIFLTGVKRYAFVILASAIGVTFFTVLSYFFGEPSLITVPVINTEITDIVLGYWVVLLFATFKVVSVLLKQDRLSVVRIYKMPVADRYIAVLKEGISSQKNVEFSVKDLEPTNIGRKIINGNAKIHDRLVALYLDDFVNDSYYNMFFKFEDKPVVADSKKIPSEVIKGVAKEIRENDKLTTK
ncbi:uncharacterized protein LOC127845351 [Dreissena polymorpha]|uniref:Uncharacterized protein n=1 Tax=Dreissena polymorpha TaxID=45954 RepID=A0A9D4E758_DREPO|nr:uncharacterized protein LOC127845351 [Dreissena polymorpha]KAH3775179.1 hypothetical protein DPMN_176578 [Dreissena polymorpha]